MPPLPLGIVWLHQLWAVPGSMQQSGVWVCLGSGAYLRCPLCPARGPLPALPVCMNRFLYDPGILPSQGGFRVPCHLATLWLQSDMPATGRKSLCGLCWWPLLSLCVRPELTRSLSSPRARTRRASWTQIPKPAACWRSVDWQGTARDCGKSPRMKTEAPGQRASWSRGGDSPGDAGLISIQISHRWVTERALLTLCPHSWLALTQSNVAARRPAWTYLIRT